jgi:hypothetical protein
MTRWLPRRNSQQLLLVWCFVSAFLGVLPTGVGGVPRALNSIVYMLFGPGIAMALLLQRRRPLNQQPHAQLGIGLPPTARAVLAATFSLTLLVLSNMVLLLSGVWSVASSVAAVTIGAVVVTLWPASPDAEPEWQLAEEDLVPAPELPPAAPHPGAGDRSDHVVMWS